MADPRAGDGDFLVYDGGIWLPPTQPLDEVDAADNFVNLLSSDVGPSAFNACVNDVGIADAGFCNLDPDGIPSDVRAELDVIRDFDTQELHAWSSQDLDGGIAVSSEANGPPAVPVLSRQPVVGRVKTAILTPRLEVSQQAMQVPFSTDSVLLATSYSKRWQLFPSQVRFLLCLNLILIQDPSNKRKLSEELLARPPPSGRRAPLRRPGALLQMTSNPFWSNTAHGMGSNIRSWEVYAAFVRDHYPAWSVPPDVSKPDQCAPLAWPPPEPVWISFIDNLLLDGMCSTYHGMMGYRRRVAKIGAEAKRLQLPEADGQAASPSLDPCALYAKREEAALARLRADHGVAKKSQGFIAQDEAVNAHKFIDLETMHGRQVLAAWLLGALSGRRAATAVAIQLQHVYFYASTAELDGYQVLIPACLIYFEVEKTPDDQGPRYLKFDRGGCKSIADSVGCDLSLALYDMLVCRGAFRGGDPLKASAPGDALLFYPSAHQWFLFCKLLNGAAIDGCPLRPDQFSRMTREVTGAMGRPERGVRAQRAGIVTRALRDVYLKKVFDSFLNADGLAIGQEWDDAQQAAALQQFRGVPLDPAPGARLVGAGTGGTSRGAHVTVLAAVAAEFCSRVLVEARALLPINRFLGLRRLFEYFKDNNPQTSCVVLFNAVTDLQLLFRSQDAALPVLPVGGLRRSTNALRKFLVP
jgi:hypothetical protein